MSFQKLVVLAQKFQKKLAQTAPDPASYLQRAAETALLNVSAGLPVSVKVSPAYDGKYDVQVKGLADPKMQATFKANLERSVASQQPSLAGSCLVNFQ